MQGSLRYLTSGIISKSLIRKKTIDDGDDAHDDDADQHETAAERRPRQRRGPGGLRIRLFGIIMICMMRRW